MISFEKMLRNIIVLIIILFVVLGVVAVAGIGLKYRSFVQDETTREYVELYTIKGDKLVGSIRKDGQGGVHFTSEGMKVVFKESELAKTVPLSEEERKKMMASSALHRTKDWFFNIFNFYTGTISESDKYLTPE